jgi:hypothetical protein
MSGFILTPQNAPEPGMVLQRTLFPITHKIVIRERIFTPPPLPSAVHQSPWGFGGGSVQNGGHVVWAVSETAFVGLTASTMTLRQHAQVELRNSGQQIPSGRLVKVIVEMPIDVSAADSELAGPFGQTVPLSPEHSRYNDILPENRFLTLSSYGNKETLIRNLSTAIDARNALQETWNGNIYRTTGTVFSLRQAFLIAGSGVLPRTSNGENALTGIYSRAPTHLTWSTALAHEVVNLAINISSSEIENYAILCGRVRLAHVNTWGVEIPI